jgi:hypothetical protein
MNRNKLLLIIISIIILLIFALFTRTPYWTAITKSKSHFIENSKDSRVLHEPGAEEASDIFAAFLPIAISTIEEKQYNQFSKFFKVYICNSQKSLNEYIAQNLSWPIRGTVLNRNIYIAPSAFNFNEIDTHKETLLHELSHLHFRQRLGFVKERKIPQWFREGFADYVSGAGGEGIDEQDAIRYILNDNHFILNEEGKPFSRERDELNGLTFPMYHQQAKMFVTFLINEDSVNFKLFVLELQNGEKFKKSFNETMKSDMQDKWLKFVADLSKK